MSKPSERPSPTASTRSSFDQHAPATAPTSGRRNRVALRDYYNLPATQARTLGSNASAATSLTSLDSSVPSQAVQQTSSTPTSLLAPLDAPNFDADKYVQNLLATGSLHELLKVQAALVQEIGGIDADRNGLVYDNYGRLIGARDVVGKAGAWLGGKEGMEKLGQLRDGISSLPPRINALVGADAAAPSAEDGEAKRQEREAADKRRKERELVAWALDGPRRVKKLVAAGKTDDAVKTWQAVEKALDGFGQVKGVDEVRRQGQEALKDVKAP